MTSGSASSAVPPHTGVPSDDVLAINFVADAGKVMLESSSSVSEVVDRIRELLPRVGLAGCSIDANMSSLILSYWHPGQPIPLTTMRDLFVVRPSLGRFTATDALLDKVGSGALTIPDASAQLRKLTEAEEPNPRRREAAMLVSVAGWVMFLNGFDAITVLVALVATLLTFPVGRLVRKLGLPGLFEVVLVALIVAAVPNLLAAWGAPVLVGSAVVGALFIYLPGRSFVSAVIDGLANAPLSSISRGLQAVVTAGALAVGMLLGSKVGLGLGLSYEPNVGATPLLISIAGATLGVAGIAAAWSMQRRQLLPTILIGAVGWFVVALAPAASGAAWALYGAAAVVVGFASGFAAWRQGATASLYSGVAILPLVPGFQLYAGMLALAQGRTAAALSSLGTAALISLAIAVGVALGLAVSRNVFAAYRTIGARMPVRTKRQAGGRREP